ncbi:hypothetical protein [Phyllobacterium sp. LjRoot231]|uniref:hypothetical protein n=1 Tax=Phyllobacterium sp. LjRoot231 TaxID=3342289 RepID=UPI003F502219
MDLSDAVHEAVSTKMLATVPLIIDSRKDASAASAGGILVRRLFKRGAAGVVMEGVVTNEACEQSIFEDSGEMQVQAERGIFAPYAPGEEATAEFAPRRQKADR